MLILLFALFAFGERLEIIQLAIFSVLSTIISVIIAFFMVKRAPKVTAETVHTMIKSGINAYNDVLEEQLQPIINASSRSMGIIASKSADVRQEKAALKAFGKDIINDNESLISMVEMVSPLFGQKLRSNPDLIIKLMPRIEAILAKQGGLEKILQGNTQNPQDNSRYWE